MIVYSIKGVDVIEDKVVSDGTHSLCTCPSCTKQKLYVNRSSLGYDCKVCGIQGYAKISSGVIEPIEIEPKVNVDESTIDKYIRKLLECCETNEYVRSYFDSHKLPIELAERFNIGYCAGSPAYEDISVAKSVGLINDKNNNRFYHRIIFPVSTNGKFVYFTSRSTIDGHVKFLDPSLRKRLFNEDCIESNDTIYVVEGIPDAISMISKGYKNTVGVLGAGVFKQEYSKLLVGKNIVLGYDNDGAGGHGKEKVYSILSPMCKSVREIELPKGFDICDYFAGGGEKVIERDIDSVEVSEKQLLFSRAESNLLTYSYSHYSVMVRDVVPRKGSLRASVDIKNSNKMIASSNLDLDSMRMRSSYAKELSGNASDISFLEAKTMMMDLSSAVKQALKDEKEEPIDKKVYIMSEGERTSAMKLLLDDKLLFRIKRALDRQAIVGENINKLLLYLIYTSRLMKKPTSCIIKGPSSSGKTYLMNRVLTLIPPEGYFTLQQATSRAFYYMGQQDMKHKMIIIGEMHGAEESQYALREAQDGINDGKLTIATVEKDPETNSMQTVIREVEGPCGFVSSTTEVEIHPENETRNFSIYVRIDEKKVRDTSKPLIDKYTGESDLLSPEEALLFHNAQRCLRTRLNVKIPYIKYILDRFPTSPIRVMRDRVRFCVLLETIAILHQYQRRIVRDDNDIEWVIANLCDYNIALILMDEILLETIYELPPKSKEIYSTVVTMKEEFVKDFPDDEMINPEDIGKKFFTTYKEISSKVKMKVDDIRRWSKPLFQAGYFDYYESLSGESQKGGRGKETKLIPVDKEFYQSFLPSPDDVANYLGMMDECVYNPLTGETRQIEKIDVEL